MQIAGLRRALAGEDDGPGWILTVPRVGYRLVAPRAEPPPEIPTVPRLAVVAFADLGGEPDRAWFADVPSSSPAGPSRETRTSTPRCGS